MANCPFPAFPLQLGPYGGAAQRCTVAHPPETPESTTHDPNSLNRAKLHDPGCSTNMAKDLPEADTVSAAAPTTRGGLAIDSWYGEQLSSPAVRTTQLRAQKASADDYGPPRSNSESGDLPTAAIPGGGRFPSRNGGGTRFPTAAVVERVGAWDKLECATIPGKANVVMRPVTPKSPARSRACAVKAELLVRTRSSEEKPLTKRGPRDSD